MERSKKMKMKDEERGDGESVKGRTKAQNE